MNFYILIRVAHDVVIDVVGLGLAHSHTEALASFGEAVGDDPTTDWVTAAVCHPSEDIGAEKDPIQEVGYDLEVPVLPTLIIQCRIDDFAKRILRHVRGTKDLDWGFVMDDWPSYNTTHGLDDFGVGGPSAPNYYARVIHQGAGLAETAAEEADELAEDTAPAGEEDVAGTEMSYCSLCHCYYLTAHGHTHWSSTAFSSTHVESGDETSEPPV
jgi:hypothetical protein